MIATAITERSIRILVTRRRPRSVARMMVRIVALAMSAWRTDSGGSWKSGPFRNSHSMFCFASGTRFRCLLGAFGSCDVNDVMAAGCCRGTTGRLIRCPPVGGHRGGRRKARVRGEGDRTVARWRGGTVTPTAPRCGAAARIQGDTVTREARRAPEARVRWFGLWDSYFVICYLVTTGLVFTSGVPQGLRVIAIGALTLVVPWYAGLGRPLMLRHESDRRNTVFAVGLFVLFGLATAVDLMSAFALFAIVPMLMMSLATRPAVVARRTRQSPPRDDDVAPGRRHRPGRAVRAAGVAARDRPVRTPRTVDQAGGTAEQGARRADRRAAAEPRTGGPAVAPGRDLRRTRAARAGDP